MTNSRPLPEDSGAGWDSSARKFDEVAAALFEGDYIAALRLARLAARQLRDSAGPEHPDYASLDAMTKGSAKA